MELDHSDFERDGGPRPARPPLRPLVGIPVPEGARERTWRSTALSVSLHLLVLALVLAPPLIASRIVDTVQGAGGPGPAGGGGGGTGGSGGVDRPIEERLRYIQVAPTPPAPSPTAVEPVVPPPEEEKKEEPTPPPVDVQVDAPKTTIDLSVVSGTGGGSGTDGSAGSGPGSGGGVGSGVGTGRGSSTGPGTGGGPGTIYPPTPVEVFIPPFPQPQKVKGKTIIALFEVDERGNVLSFTFTPTGDRGYDRRVRETLSEVRFRPATTWEGKPVRAQARLDYVL